MSSPSENGSNSINDPSTDLASLITQVGTTWAVKAHPNEPYFRVFIDINNIITSCDCLSFVSTQTPCIHMCMLKWYNKGIILAHSNQQTNVAPHSQPPRQQSMQQPLPQQPLPQQPLPQQPLPQQPLPKQPLPKQPLPKQPLPKQPLPQQSLPLPSKRGRPKNDFIASTKRAFKYYKPQSKLPTTPAPQQASPVQQPSSMQSPVSSAIQQQLQLQLTRHLQPLRPAVQTKAAQKQPEQIKDIDKLVTLLTELNKKYETIRPSCSLSPPSLPPNMNSDIVLRGKKIALEAQAAMRNGVTGKKLEDFIMAMLERERTDITSKPSSSSTSTANTSSPASTSTAKTPCPLTSRTPVASTAPAASSPISISSGPSTPATSSPLARSATSSSACGKAVQVNSTVVASKSPSPVVNAPSTSVVPATPPSTLSPVVNAPSTSVAPATPPSTLSPVASPPKAATPSLAAATATASTSTATASLASASSSPEASSSSATAAGKKRRKLPAFAMSAFLRTKKEIKSEKKYVKSEGCSSQHRPYLVVEPIEGYDAAIARMIDNMKNEKKGTSSDLWSISSSSSEDEEEDSKSD